MKRKSDTFSCFKKFHALAETHTGSNVKKVNLIKRTQHNREQLTALGTDNCGEYLSHAFKEYLENHGIHHQLTIAYTPQQNGVAERMNRTLMDLIRSMLQTASLEKSFWAEALSTAVYIRNRVLSRSLPEHITPHHRWFHKPPNISHVRVFGCQCWYVVPKKDVKKLDPRSREGVMVGYSSQSKGYKIWDTGFKKFVLSRDVTFHESFNDSSKVTVSEVDDIPDDSSVPGGEVKTDVNESIDQEETHPSEANYVETESDGEFQDTNNNSPTPLRRSGRIRKPTGEWWKSTANFAHALSAQAVPISYKVATSENNIDFWLPGIDREQDCITRNKTWSLVHRKPGMHVLPSKYVFKVKDGKPKVRLVAVGSRQIHGIDYNETFAPVVKLSSIRVILALGAHYDLELEQMDVVTAFLNGDLEKDIYMNIHEGFRTTTNSHMVCKLQKSLYGLKQSPRQWYGKMHMYLFNDLGFSSSQNDPCSTFDEGNPAYL